MDNILKSKHENFKASVDEFKSKIIPELFKEDLLPGYTRATLTQIERHILKLSRKHSVDNVTILLFAYGIVLGEVLVKTVDGAEWVYEAPSISYLRVKLPMQKENKEDDDIYALPILRVINLFNTKDKKNKGIVMYYDNLIKQFNSLSIVD